MYREYLVYHIWFGTHTATAYVCVCALIALSGSPCVVSTMNVIYMNKNTFECIANNQIARKIIFKSDIKTKNKRRANIMQ